MLPRETSICASSDAIIKSHFVADGALSFDHHTRIRTGLCASAAFLSVFSRQRGSPAAEAGIEPGDVIVSIDKSSAERMTLTELRDMLRGPNTRCSVAILRGSRGLKITLQLRPLL
jgi:C-terminal processing protease CtpA/Prc